MEAIAIAIVVAKDALVKRMTVEKIDREQRAGSIVPSEESIEPFESERRQCFRKV
jgi:hypothetical protein